MNTDMSREIKFRGKRVDSKGDIAKKILPDNTVVNADFIYGDKVEVEGKVYILTDDAQIVDDGPLGIEVTGFIEVHPDTVGQSIDFKDDDNKEIYEGDLCLANDTFIDEVVFGNGGFIFDGRCPQTQATQIVAWNHLKIIGTIHDEEKPDA